MYHYVSTSLYVLWLSTAGCHGSITCDTLCACQTVSPKDITVHCSGCSLTAIPVDIPTNVTSLDVSFNSIESLDVGKLPSFPRLSRLDLSNNRLARVGAGAFLRLGALLDLDMDNNRLRQVTSFMFSQAPLLKLISLGSNSIARVEARAFSNLSLDRLSLRDNLELVALDERAFMGSKIHSLILDRCGFVTLPAELLWPLTDSLAVLSISEMPNGFKPHERSFQNLNLTNLHLIKNKMTETDLNCFQTIGQVRNMDISGNNYISLNISVFGGQSAIENLVLKSSNIEQLVTSCKSPTSQFETLKSLDISRNSLASLPNTMFDCFPQLRVLKLSWNPLIELSPTLRRPFNNLDVLDISNISKSCDCAVEWFVEWRTRTHTTVYGDLCSNSSGVLSHCSNPQTITSWVDTIPSDEEVQVFCKSEGGLTPELRITGHSTTGAVNVSSKNSDQVSVTILIDTCTKFTCIAVNSEERHSHSFYVCPNDTGQANGTSSSPHAWVVGPVLIVLLCLLVVIILVRKYIKSHRTHTDTKIQKRNDIGADSIETRLIIQDSC